jgi:hypothetical protein
MLGDVTNRRYSSVIGGQLQQDLMGSEKGVQMDENALRFRKAGGAQPVKVVGESQQSVAVLWDEASGIVDRIDGETGRVNACPAEAGTARIQPATGGGSEGMGRPEPAMTESSLTEEERDAKARALVKEARKHQAE